MPKVETPPKVQLTIRIDGDILDRLTVYARTSRIPRNVILQLAVNEYLDRAKAPWPADTEPD